MCDMKKLLFLDCFWDDKFTGKSIYLNCIYGRHFCYFCEFLVIFENFL